MVFSSMLFLWIFLPLVLAAYYISPGKIRNGILVFFSLLFYAWGEPLYVFLMLFSVAVNFTGGILIEKYQTRKKKILVATLIINLGLLGYFKYFGTLTEAITGLFSADGTGTTLFQVALPIGISFYTFQALSYVIDVYRGEVPAQHNFWHMLLYISFFPQLIAGPIVKYRDIAAQITGRKETTRKFAAGIMRFCWGLGKKVLLANSFARVVDEIFKYGPYAVSRKALWLGAILYMMQIYYDFSGYSDMAIGMGLMIGFHYKENFNYPYLSSTVSEFWRRWHISLGSFFRDYVYIPLGGSRKGLGRTILNLFVVWALTGLWHGASWNFVLWGLYFFIFIALERLFLNKVFARLPGFVSHIYLLIVVYFGWILFRFKNMALIGVVLKGMFCQNGNPWTTFEANTTLLNYIFFLAIAVIAVTPVVHNIGRAISVASGRSAAWFRVNSVVQVAMPLVLLLISTMSLVGNSYNPFLYFQF